MTTKNAGEKEQGMSEGPYKAELVDGIWRCVGPQSWWHCGDCRDSYDSELTAKRMNLAHAHATDAAARRVRELEEALRVASTMCVKCFGRGTYSTGCPCIDDPRWEPDYHNCGAYDAECDDSTCVKVRAALAGKERSDGAN